MIVSDKAACKATVAADKATVADEVAGGKTAIAQVKTQIRIDKGNSSALAVDRDSFSRSLTAIVEALPSVRIMREEIQEIPATLVGGLVK